MGRYWLFGRGASIDCGLSWTVPEKWKYDLLNGIETRENHIKKINSTLLEEMKSVHFKENTYYNFLEYLSKNTEKNRFATTNWDYLLQRELTHWIKCNNCKSIPDFLIKGTQGSMVYHFNGSIEQGEFRNRSKILLETDESEVRQKSYESNNAFNDLLECSDIVIVGMSFECDVDKGLLKSFKNFSSDFPISKAKFTIVNPCKTQSLKTIKQLKECFPLSTTINVNLSFKDWITKGMPTESM
jgi:hypothetical protein